MQVKGFYTESVYMGFYNGKYRPFETEGAYREMVKDEEDFADILENAKADLERN